MRRRYLHTDLLSQGAKEFRFNNEVHNSACIHSAPCAPLREIKAFAVYLKLKTRNIKLPLYGGSHA